VTQVYDEFLRASGLRGTQFSLLIAVRAMGPVTVTKLAFKTMMDRTTLGRNLMLLEKKALIRIEPGEDKRVREVTLTDEGLDALRRALPLWEEAQAHVVNSLGEERMNGLLNHLAALVSLVRRA
jgi:DNA-binding MarR family transcriptional regulator